MDDLKNVCFFWSVFYYSLKAGRHHFPHCDWISAFFWTNFETGLVEGMANLFDMGTLPAWENESTQQNNEGFLVVVKNIFYLIPTWGNDPIWLIFFNLVETTN